MIGARLWKRRRGSQPVATVGVAFDDSRDFIASDFRQAGADNSYPLTASLPRLRSRVHRFSAPLSAAGALSFDLPPLIQIRRKVLAAAFSPAFPRTYPRVLAGKSVGKLGRTHPRVLASFAEFNRLRADPRTSMCVRRSQRREVLFARRVAGRVGRSPGRGGGYSRNVHSQWSC